jgi:thiamine biosynthesis lipoprotein
MRLMTDQADAATDAATALPGLDGPLPAASATAVPGFDGAVPLVEVPRAAWVEQIMGMPISIHVRTDNPRSAEVTVAVEQVFAELRHVDAVFSMWKPDSEVSRLSRAELALADCDHEVREVVELCGQARERTEGWFDADLPGPDGGRRFDPTGLVKGWAVERASRHLAALAGADFMLNAGGDVAVGCHRTDTPDWRLGIENPADRSRMVATVPLRTGGIATSGTAARGTHILVPGSGLPATGLLAVSVIGPSLMWADVYATAAFARGPECVSWLAGLTDHVGLVVALDGTLTTTP